VGHLQPLGAVVTSHGCRAPGNLKGVRALISRARANTFTTEGIRVCQNDAREGPNFGVESPNSRGREHRAQSINQSSMHCRIKAWLTLFRPCS
jgi:hypothetical protein